MTSGPLLIICSSTGETLRRVVEKYTLAEVPLILLSKKDQRIPERFPNVEVIETGMAGPWSLVELDDTAREKLRGVSPASLLIVYRGDVGAGGYENVEDMALGLAGELSTVVMGIGEDLVSIRLIERSFHLRRKARRAANIAVLAAGHVLMPLLTAYIHWADRRERSRSSDFSTSGERFRRQNRNESGVESS